MKIYLSSTQIDLGEYREQVALALRQMGHEVLYMEEYTAEETRPLDRCVGHVTEADLYVGIFAWRYGHVPASDPSFTDLPRGVTPGSTSITEAEYHAASDIPRIIFLLDERTSWPPALMDAHTGDGEGGRRIKELRSRLGERHVVAFFTSPDSLAREVMAAVRRQELFKQLELQTLQPVEDAHSWMMNPEFPEPYSLYDSAMMSMTEKIEALDDETYMIVDLGVGRSWWSTRLYFLASLLVDLTDVRLLVFVDKARRLFGVSSAVSVQDALARRLGPIRDYEQRLASGAQLSDLEQELGRRGNAWESAMEAAGREVSVKSWVRKQELGRFLGQALTQRSIEWSDDGQAHGGVVALVDQIIKWPQDLVPLTRNGLFFKVVERNAITEEVARIFINERLGSPLSRDLLTESRRPDAQ